MTQSLELLTIQRNEKLKSTFRAIEELGEASTEQLLDKTGYKPATLARQIEKLLSLGYIENSGVGESTGGRRPSLYQIHPEAGYIIGIEMNSMYTTVLILNAHLRELDVEKLKIKEQDPVLYSLDLALNAIDLLLERNHLAREQLIGIGLSGTDFLDGIYMQAENSRFSGSDGARAFDLAAYVKNRFDVTVGIYTGVHAAAILEYRTKYSKRYKSLLFTTCDFDLKSAYTYMGAFPFSDENQTNLFSHLTIDHQGRPCSCGLNGCLHQYCSMYAIKDEIVAALLRGEASDFFGHTQEEIDSLDFRQIHLALANGEPLAKVALQKAAYYFGVGLSNAILLIKPEVVVVGGALVPTGRFFEIATDTALRRIRAVSDIEVRIEPASGSYDTIAQGAGYMIWENLLR